METRVKWARLKQRDIKCAICGCSFTTTATCVKYCPDCRGKKVYISKRRSYDQSIEANRRSSLRWQSNHPDKYQAQSMAKSHAELLTILYECSCDSALKHNHHFDYSRPLEVIRLCPACHSAEHSRLRSLAVA
jgi:Zn finger protein HypA/HybF involved in hydrogenase expression